MLMSMLELLILLDHLSPMLFGGRGVWGMLLKFRRVGKAQQAHVACSRSWLQSGEVAEPVLISMSSVSAGKERQARCLGTCGFAQYTVQARHPPSQPLVGP